MKCHRATKTLLMRIITSMLIVASLQVAATPSAGQITIHAKSIDLESVMRKIKEQTSYQYLFGIGVNAETKISLNVSNATLTETLTQSLRDLPYTYKIVDKVIAIVSKPAGTMIPNGIFEPAPPIDIHGKILDEKGEPVPGATIYLKGSRNRTQSGDNGEFSIRSASSSTILLISSVGFSDTSIVATGDKPVIVHLKIRLAALDEATVISNGYQQIPKERATGSFFQLDNKLVSRRVSTDILGRLEGVTPGLLFNRNTQASSASGHDINIRGHSTIFSNDQPLIVVDNFPYDGDVSNINPNDVESITVLKDAAAASIYGVQSGNGVIVITTKKGKLNQKLLVEINANTTIADKINYFYNPNHINSTDLVDIQDTLLNRGYYKASLNSLYHPAVPQAVQIFADAAAGKISQADATQQINDLRNTDVRSGVSKYFARPAVLQQYSINLRGGNSNSTYVFSVGFDKNAMTLKANSNQRFTINSQYFYYPIKNLELSTLFNYVQSSDRMNNPGLEPSRLYSYTGFTDPLGNPAAIPNGYNLSWVSNPTAMAGLLNWQYVPLNEMKYADNTSNSTDNRLGFGIKYTFFKGFSAEVRYNYEKATGGIKNYYSDSTYYARNLINMYTNLNGTVVHPVPVGGILNSINSTLESNRVRGQLNYTNTFNAVHQVAAIAGAEISSVSNNSNTSSVYGYDQNTGNFQNVDFVNQYPTFPTGFLSVIPSGLGFSGTTNRFVSYYSNLSYTYNRKYIFSVSGRIDHSNLFGVSTNQKRVPLYSAGFCWDVDKETFYKISWLPLLKARVTYGYTGNVNTTATGVTTIRQLSNSYYQQTPFAQIASPGNPELQWEKTRMVNYGIEFGTIHNRIAGTVEYYTKKADNLFGSAPLAPSTGLTFFYGNTANTQGKGWDITINSRNIVTANFSWTTTFIFNYAMDKVTKYLDTTTLSTSYITYGASNTGSFYPIEGKPVFAIYSYPSAGLTHNTGDPQGYLNGKLSTDYASIISSTTIHNMNYNGPSRPTTFGSLRNSFSYKHLTLSFNIIYKFNYYFKRASIDYGALYTSGQGNVDYYKRWQKPGDELNTIVPSLQYPPVDNSRATFYTQSSALVDKGDHIRLQDIGLNYELTKAQLPGLPFSSLVFYTYINNIGLIWRANHDGLDPDVYSFQATTAYPLPRSYSFGIKASF